MKLAFVTNKPYQSCETFVKLQIDNLPFHVIQYYSFNHPFLRENDNARTKGNLLSRFFFRNAIEQTPEQQTSNRLKKDKIDIVIAQYGTVGILFTNVCQKLKIPLIVHFHGHDAVRHSVISEHALAYKKMFDYATAIISVSHVMTEKLKALGCPENKIVYNPYGPHPSFFSIAPNYSKKQLIAIGRFVEKKAPDLLIRSFAQILQSHPDTILLFAGDGPLLNSCKELAKGLSISESIIFLGVISPKEYRRYLHESQVFVQHSITASDGDMEGTPVAILEASAAGLPVVSTFHAGIPDVILDGKTGYLVDEKDIDTMAARIIALLNDIPLAKKMGAAGKVRIKTFFTSQQYINQLSDAILSAGNRKNKTEKMPFRKREIK